MLTTYSMKMDPPENKPRGPFRLSLSLMINFYASVLISICISQWDVGALKTF